VLSYLGAEVEAVGTTGTLDENDNLLDPSLLFKTDFILETYLLKPFFFSSAGVAGTGVAGVLMLLMFGSNQWRFNK